MDTPLCGFMAKTWSTNIFSGGCNLALGREETVRLESERSRDAKAKARSGEREIVNIYRK